MRSNKKFPFFITTLLLLPALSFAATQDTDTRPADYNMLLIGMVSLMLILLFVIGVLASTLRQLSLAVSDKIRMEKNVKENMIKTVLLIAVFLIPSLHSFAAGPAEVLKAAAPEVTQVGGIPIMDYYAIVSMLIVEISVIFSLVIFIRIMLRSLTVKPVEELAVEATFVEKKSWFWDNFNKAVPVEKEKDLLLDHNYDGIRELDNSLPPWWKYGFYLTIIVAFIYVYRFHISHDGLSQNQEYALEMQKGEEDKAAYLAHSANNVDESTVTALLDAGAISAGKEVFTKNCVACHMPDGGGSVGPNLTDDYWLHGGGIKDIFKSVKYGWQDKGMKSWKDDLSPKEIQEVASFIKSIKGTHPATPKAPQGELYIDAAPTENAADTTKKADVKTGKVAVK